MTRKEVKVSIKMRTNGNIYVCPGIMGEIIVYDDQLIAINNKISKCRTREEAKDIIHDFSCGLDLHHSDVQVPTIRKKSARQPVRASPTPRKPTQSSYTPPLNTNQVKTPQTNSRSRKTNITNKAQSPVDTQIRISGGSDSVHEIE